MVSILVGAIAMFVIGALWFTVLFGRMWSRLMNFPPEVSAKMRSGGMGWKMVVMFVLNLITAAALHQLLGEFHTMMFSEFWGLTLLIGAGFTLPQFINPYLWEARSSKIVLINIAQALISYSALAAIIYYMY